MNGEDGADIYYTTNGDDPTTSSTKYSAPFQLQSAEASATVKAIAVESGLTDSEIVSKTYTNSNVSTLSDDVASIAAKSARSRKKASE